MLSKSVLLSPEIVQYMGYGEKADIWSFGCCIYEMAALQPPSYSQNMLALATQIVEGKYEPLSSDRSRCSTPLW